MEKITKVTGIKAVVKFIAGEDCGCDERKEKLNKITLWSAHRAPLCLTQEEYDYWTQHTAKGQHKLNREALLWIVKIWNRVFQTRKKYSPCTCNPDAWQRMITDINLLYDTYQDDPKP